MILFAPLRSTDDGGEHIQENFRALMEISSSLLGDFSSMLYNGHLDGEAIQDCGRWIGTSCGKVRDRSSQNWGLLVYFFIGIIMMFQGSSDDVADALEWVMVQITRSAYELQHHSGKLDQFILAVHKVRTVASSNPLTQEQKVIYHHNFRTNIVPEGFMTSTGGFYALRVEPICHVIKEVLGLNFKPAEIQTSSEFVDWARYSRGKFYDCTLNPWPICKVIFQEHDQSMHSVPLPEDELLESTLHRYRCLFIKKDSFDKVISDVERGSAMPNDPKTVMISSANPAFNGGDKYCFYEVVTCRPGAIPWFGYRFATQCTFSEFCFTNQVQIGGPTTPLLINAALQEYNISKGFGKIEDCFEPRVLYKFFKDYKIHADPARLPPCFQWDPFGYKNDESCFYSMPRILFSTETTHARDYLGISPSRKRTGNGESVAEGEGITGNEHGCSSSNPVRSPLSDLTNSPDVGAPRGGPNKRRRTSLFIDTEAADDGSDDDDDDDDEEVCLASMYDYLPTYLLLPFFYHFTIFYHFFTILGSGRV